MQKCYFYLEALVGLPAFGSGMQSPWPADDLWAMPALHHQPKRNLLPIEPDRVYRRGEICSLSGDVSREFAVFPLRRLEFFAL